MHIADRSQEPSIDVTVREEGGTPVVVVAGEVDMWTAPTLRECLFGLSEQGSARAIVDLEAVEFLDSTALGVLVGAHKRFVQAGGGLVLVCTMPRILRVLEVTGLVRVFAVHPSVEDALGPS